MSLDITGTHVFLVSGQDYETSRNKVMRFFDKNVLVKYDTIDIVAEESCPAPSAEFWERAESAIAQNRKQLINLVRELQESGHGDLNGWDSLPQGYPSKIVHTIAHLVDGFFGIDSAFYNLIDDSHWISSSLRREIERSRNGFWLVKAVGRSDSGADRIPFLRRQGKA